MMNWWKRYSELKHARELVKGTRKILRMHRDILEPRQVTDTASAADALQQAVKARDATSVGGLIEKLDRQLERAFPRQPFAELRENVEVFLVAAIVAMAVRTFFIQPFKIPTGSMQPSLYGIVPSTECQSRNNIVSRLYGGVVHGAWPQRANSSVVGSVIEFVTWAVSGQPSDGSVCVFSGDHIFVDRFTYHFRKPQRGEVIVFDTTDITDLPEMSRGKFYIKRLVGLGGDSVRIEPPQVLVNDQVLTGAAFQKIYSMSDGYGGYVLPYWNQAYGKISQPHYINSNVSNEYRVPEHHLFVLGDNSTHSLDGRFWGSVEEDALVGRAILVYWPFTKRFGVID